MDSQGVRRPMGRAGATLGAQASSWANPPHSPPHAALALCIYKGQIGNLSIFAPA